MASVAPLSGAILIGTADTIGFWPAVSLAMVTTAACGLRNGPVVLLIGIDAFFVTPGTLTAIRGLVPIDTDGRSLAVRDPEVVESMKAFEAGRHDVAIAKPGLAAVLTVVGVVRASRRGLDPAAPGPVIGGVGLALISWASGFTPRRPNPVIDLAIFALALRAILNFTMVGRRVYAVGGKQEAARLSGINVFRYKRVAFVLSSAAAGFAGVPCASRLRSINPTALQGSELTVIASAILGGTALVGGSGSVIWTGAGALLLCSLTNGFNILNLGATCQGLIEGMVVAVAAAIYAIGSERRR